VEPAVARLFRLLEGGRTKIARTRALDVGAGKEIRFAGGILENTRRALVKTRHARAFS
jgi:hypothetical protein